MKIKNLFSIFAFGAAMLAVGCATDATEDLLAPESGVEGTTVIEASLDASTRVTLGDLVEGTRKVYWANGDQINVNGTTSAALENVGENAGRATFTFEGTLETPYKGLYPATNYKNETTVTLPSLMWEPTLSMAAYNATGTGLQFKHIVGMVKLSLKAKADGDSHKISAVLFKGNNSEQVAGDFTIDWETLTLTAASTAATDKSVCVGVDKALSAEATEVFIPVPAGTYENGFTVKIIDEMGHYMEQKKVSSFEVAAGEITSFPAVEFAPTGTDVLADLITAESGSQKINDELLLEGVVISDSGNTNMAYNYWGTTEQSTNYLHFSLLSSYVQRADGSLGFYVKFPNKVTSTLKRYSKVILSLKGTTLKKEADPTRYTINDFTVDRVIKQVDGDVSNIVKKEKTIAELTDADVHTWVSLKDVQIGINDGAYTNLNEGGKCMFLPYINSIPLTFFDRNGDNIRMLTNAEATWRRDGTGVPKGSGTLNGILVSNPFIKRVGDIGKWQIRVIDEADIDLAETATENDAKTLVEWNWNNTSKTAPDKNSDGTLKPDLGTGSMYSTLGTYGNKGAAANAIKLQGTNTGTVTNAAANFSCGSTVSWWNFTENKGEAIIAKFSTTGISGTTLVAIFDIQGGSGNTSAVNKFPTYWHVEYSTDGNSWTKIENSKITVRPLTHWQNVAAMVLSTVLYNDYAISLPAELFGQDNVYVALRASSAISEHGIDAKLNDAAHELASTETGTGNIRINTFSIRYF